jgi:hypothetical protein
MTLQFFGAKNLKNKGGIIQRIHSTHLKNLWRNFWMILRLREFIPSPGSTRRMKMKAFSSKNSHLALNISIQNSIAKLDWIDVISNN